MLKGSCDLYVEIEQQSGYPFVNCLRFTLVQKKKLLLNKKLEVIGNFKITKR